MILKRNSRKAFTIVEILMVVGIIAILAAISSPLLLQHQKRAVASEAVANLALIRQGLRDYYINGNTYFDIGAATGYIENDFPNSVSGGVPTPANAGVDVDIGVTQYFSNHAYSIDSTNPSSARFTNPPVVDFLITVNGADSVACTSGVTDDCAINAARVASYDLEMDNSGRIFVSYDNGTNWKAY